MKELTGRSAMKSPGRPSLRRDVERRFLGEIAKGLTSEEAGVAVGASSAAASRWFRERGGMPTFTVQPVAGRYLSFEEREQIALFRAQGAGVDGLPGNWAVRPQRFCGSCAATRLPAAAGSTTAPR